MWGMGARKSLRNIGIEPIVLNGKQRTGTDGRQANGSNVSSAEKPTTPRYRKPTVETILKDVRSQRQQPKSKDFRKENPNFKYTRDQQVADYAAVPQSQMLNSFDFEFPASRSPRV